MTEGIPSITDYLIDKMTKDLEELDKIPLVWTKEEETPEPSKAEEQLTREEINEKIKHYWKLADSVEGFDSYKSAWDNLNYYRDLKQKLYK